MAALAPRQIRPVRSIDLQMEMPPSKSYTNRALIAASLAEGPSMLVRPSKSEDSMLLVRALRQFGVTIDEQPGRFAVAGTGGELLVPPGEIDVGNAGTAMRFLTTFASIVRGETVITGDENMRRRTLQGLLDALKAAGVRTTSQAGFPPVKIHGGSFAGGSVGIDAAVSSQFISSILLSSPYAKHPVALHARGKISSLPYVTMTLHVMRSFGAGVDTAEFSHFRVDNTQKYIGQEFTIEGDASAATYFLASAAITGGHVVIANLSTESLQGDIRFLGLLGEMGCRIAKRDDAIELHGGRLRGIEVDMNEIPDSVPALAVVAAFAEGPTSIIDVEHLKHKETNRLAALATELTRLGARVDLHEDGLTIHPKPLKGAAIETYNDHRMAMSFAVAGLRVTGISITNPGCVGKSFPTFWDEFEKLEQKE
jgi:3-phosphoshikimate 1-carboxyvinyltransferase